MACFARRRRAKRLEAIAMRIVVSVALRARALGFFEAQAVGVAGIATQRAVLAGKRKASPGAMVERKLGQRGKGGGVTPSAWPFVEQVSRVRRLVTITAVSRRVLFQIELGLG